MRGPSPHVLPTGAAGRAPTSVIPTGAGRQARGVEEPLPVNPMPKV